MTRSEAKAVLELYRPDSVDATDAQVVEALGVARHDTELNAWLKQHSRFQTAMQQKFRNIPVPANLKAAILEREKIIVPAEPWWRNRLWLRVAAAVALVAGLCVALVAISPRSHTPDRFADYKTRMVRSALREYRMDLLTDDLQQLRQLAASRNAPADFAVPKGLSRLKLTGGGVLRWRNNPVAMVCYDRGDHQMLFLFVMDRSAVKDSPGSTPQVGKVSKLTTASWSEGDKVYVLAGPDDEQFVAKYF